MKVEMIISWDCEKKEQLLETLI